MVNTQSQTNIVVRLTAAMDAAESRDYANADSLYQELRAEFTSIASIASNHGNVLLQLGKIVPAIDAYRQAVTLDPGKAGYHYNLGNALFQKGDFAESIVPLKQALAIDPKSFDAWFTLGNSFLKQSEFSDAHSAYMKAVMLDSGNPELHSNLSNALMHLHRFEDAADMARQAIRLNPYFAEAYANLGNILARTGRFTESISAYEQAIIINPDYTEAWCDLGYACLQLGRSLEALDAFTKAVSLNPDYGEAQLYRALALLRLGHYQQGWDAYEWRWKTRRQENKKFPADHILKWNGECLQGKHLLVWQEQGYGDTIQFGRYIFDLIAQGAKISLLVDQALVRLMRSIAGISAIVTELPPGFAADFQVPIMSLPGLLRLEFGNSIAPVPYLFAEEDLIAAWQQKLETIDGFKIGLVWSGDPRPHDRGAHLMDQRRSLSLAQLSPLAAVQGVSFISLQKGEAADQIESQSFWAPIFDASGHLETFADTAALIATLDLVISVDTSMAHLAGALGKPTWIMSRLDGCWRWLEGRDDTPWYPKARLFRQTDPGDWDNVVRRIVEALENLPRTLTACT